MDTGILIALGFAVVIIVVALLLGRMLARAKRRKHNPHDLNASPHDGRASGTWVGIREAGRNDGTDHP